MQALRSRRILIIFILTPAKQKAYSLCQIKDWSMFLRAAANHINDTDTQLANHFYSIHYAIGPDQAEEEFDPYRLDEDYLIAFGGKMEDIIWSLRMVLANGQRYVDPAAWDNGLKNYLQELLAKLTQ